jgi:hypothetical protein
MFCTTSLDYQQKFGNLERFMKTLGVTAGIVVLLVISMVTALLTANSVIAAVLCIFGWSPAVLALGVAIGRFVNAPPSAKTAVQPKTVVADAPPIPPAAAPVRQRRFPLSDGAANGR